MFKKYLTSYLYCGIIKTVKRQQHLENCIRKGENIMKINDKKIVKRFNDVMECIGCEHIAINSNLSELESNKEYYSIENGISVEWMLKEAEYWLSCYYDSGNVRCNDRFYGKEEYKIWVSETGKLKRLVERLSKYSDWDFMVAEW